MEGPHATHSRAHRERLKQEQQFARQIMFVADQAFAERTEIPRVLLQTSLLTEFRYD